MRILNAEFIKSSTKSADSVPQDFAEVAFLGRSNVGKSSLLNRLVESSSVLHQSSDQARVGKTPGATASVNLYVLKDRRERDILGLVDLPGFGYARLSKDVKESVQATAEHYLNKRKELMLGILLLDIRRSPSDDDKAVLAALFDMGVPILVVATKADKISSEHEREIHLREINQKLGLPEGQPLCVSSVTGEGCRELWRILLEGCEAGVEDFKSTYDAETAALKSVSAEQSEEGLENNPFFNDFEDTDEVVYDQGYDWVRDNFGSDEEEEDSWSANESKMMQDEDFYYDDGDQKETNHASPPKESLRALKIRARDMERRGEL